MATRGVAKKFSFEALGKMVGQNIAKGGGQLQFSQKVFDAPSGRTAYYSAIPVIIRGVKETARHAMPAAGNIIRSEMRRILYAQGGTARFLSEFGITTGWTPLAPATLRKRRQRGVSGTLAYKDSGQVSDFENSIDITVSQTTETANTYMTMSWSDKAHRSPTWGGKSISELMRMLEYGVLKGTGPRGMGSIGEGIRSVRTGNRKFQSFNKGRFGAELRWRIPPRPFISVAARTAGPFAMNQVKGAIDIAIAVIMDRFAIGAIGKEQVRKYGIPKLFADKAIRDRLEKRGFEFYDEQKLKPLVARAEAGRMTESDIRMLLQGIA